MRVLVTGSRDWDDEETIYRALYEVMGDGSRDESLVVVHGGARGADEIAARWANLAGGEDGITDESHPADWNTHGKAAGPIRNTEMVALGADLCLAFIKNESRGATDCADKAEAAGIETRRFTA